MGTIAMISGSLVAAVLAYGFHLLGGRALGPAAFAPISVLWTVQFLTMMILYQPLEHYINREANQGHPPPLTPVLVFGGASGLVATASMLVMGDVFLLEPLYAVLGGVMVFGYSFFGYARGRLAGTERFVSFGVITAGEAAIRLALAVVLVWTFRAAGLAWAMAIAPFIGAIWLRRTASDGHLGPLARNLTPLIAASLFAQGLLGLGPLVAGALGGTAALISIVFMTFTMYRGPLWILQAIMARLMPVFVDLIEVDAREALHRWIYFITVGGLAGAAVSFVLGRTFGPALLEVLLSPAFRPAPEFSGLVAAGVAIAAFAGLLTQLLLAMNALRSITANWLLAFAAAAVVVLVAPFSVDIAIGEAFVVGELIALCGLAGTALASLREVAVVHDAETVSKVVSV